MITKKENRNGFITLTSAKFAPFLNSAAALIAMQALQAYLAEKGFNVTSRVNLNYKAIELTAFFDGAKAPNVPSGYRYTSRKITSHSYYSEAAGREVWNRTIDYGFEY